MLVVGLSHRTAPIEVREKLALGEQGLAELLARLLGLASVRESVVLSTCNRVEIYVAVNEAERARRAVVELLCEVGGTAVADHLTTHTDHAAVTHLFRVASSLDSLVVGEPQILGQLKEAIRVAEEARAVGSELGAAMRAALGVAKKVRTETAIGAGQVSISSVAVDLARQIFEDMQDRTALLVGAGEMAEAAAKILAKSGARLLVCNRSPGRAQALAEAVDGTARPWEELDLCLGETDIVITSTASPGYVVTLDKVKALRKARRGRSLFFIDIAVPRDVEPTVNQLDNVYLYDIDDLQKVVSGTLEERAVEAERAERLVAEEVRRYQERSAERNVAPLIQQLRERTRTTLQAELERSLRGRLRHLTEADKDALGAMLDAAVNKLLHAPSTRLRALARAPQGEEMAQAVRQLFELEGRSHSDPDIRVEPLPDSLRPGELQAEAEPVQRAAKAMGGE
ncbi:MAG: glutamyl-tRNA reductase [Myxococcales bacterium]|nr:glutamyl-tRNA reductase [Myxococcales bacterium]